MKRLYEKPSINIYELWTCTSLLQASSPDGNNPFEWGYPDDDR